jgi:hypothetical protein
MPETSPTNGRLDHVLGHDLRLCRSGRDQAA